VSKPPKSGPHSDLDGIHEDEESNIESANKAGHDSADLERAARETVARPSYGGSKNPDEGRG
jgi:hypothetical protein